MALGQRAHAADPMRRLDQGRGAQAAPRPAWRCPWRSRRRAQARTVIAIVALSVRISVASTWLLRRRQIQHRLLDRRAGRIADLCIAERSPAAPGRHPPGIGTTIGSRPARAQPGLHHALKQVVVDQLELPRIPDRAWRTPLYVYSEDMDSVKRETNSVKRMAGCVVVRA